MTSPSFPRDRAATARTSPWEWLRAAPRVMAVCLLITLLLSAIQGWPGWRDAGLNLVYSLCIGMSCWLLIDGSRVAIAHLLHQRYPDDPDYAHCWPRWGWMSVCIVVGAVLGFVVGQALADLLTGQQTARLWGQHWSEATFMLLISVTASLSATAYFHIRGRMAAAQADAEHARRLAVETQLRLLQTQLEPHMLFNTLANLRVLIGMDAARAQTMLDQLIAFLRATLEASRVGEHPLSTEFARLRDYLSLMQVRMGERLQTQLDLPPALATQPLPPLLLQALVENAIKHGLEPQVRGGLLRVRAAEQDGRLLLQVQDDGLGQAAGAQHGGTGFGLQQVRERLQSRYGEQASLTLSYPAAGGCLVEIRLPLQTTAAPQTAP